MTGRWDGSTFTVTGAIPAALYDAMAPEEPTGPEAGARPTTRHELDDIADGARRATSRARRVPSPTDGHVLVDVTYDDGSLQAWADEEYGTNVVIVVPALVDGP